MAKAAPNHGHALYLEFHGTDGAGQTLFSQHLITGYGASGGSLVPYKLFSRNVTEKNPQSFWKPEQYDGNGKVLTALDGKLTRADRPEVAVEVARDAFDHVMASLDAMASFKWDFYERPLVIQTSALDLQDIKNGQTPKKLLDRVRKVRSSLGWPDLPSGKPKGAKV